MLLMIVAAVLYNLNVRFFSEIIGEIKSDNPYSFNNALKFVYWFAGCSIAAIIAKHYATYFTDAYFLVPVKSRMEQDLFSYLLGHSYEFITSKQSGMLIAQKNDVKQLPEMLNRFMWDLEAIFDILVKTILLILISPVIGIGYFLLGVMVIFPGKYFSKMLIKANKIRAKTSAIVSGRILDTVNNLELVKQFYNIEYEKQRLKPLLKQEYDHTIKATIIFFKQFTAIGVAVSLSSFLLLVTAVYFWSMGQISTADVVFILITLTGGLNQIAMIFESLQYYKVQIAKIEQGLEPFAVTHSIIDVENAKDLKAKKGEIVFKDVSFTYANKRKPVFKNFNLTIHSQEKVGIVGESGSGKTTLINLLQRAYDIQSGQILIDGQDISTVTQESLHQNISLIPQDTVMFNRSIAENIAFGMPNVTLKQIRVAAKKAYADYFIEVKEGRYNGFAGDRGCQLSGGERQRIAIARAILRKAPILILDEATSALDSESEQIINKAIENAIQNQTVIAIAHRLSTLKNMDRILVMHKGEIVEEGRFDELIAKGGKFAKLYFAQQKKRRGKNV
ncbi:MAG: ABC transporter ATP-binding protein/permease [Acetobacter sp.]|nr:ABC transporter ATP-binding protein/permease [Acetobacter sp.]